MTKCYNLTEEDLKQLAEIKAKIEKKIGKCSDSAVIRFLINFYAKCREKVI